MLSGGMLASHELLVEGGEKCQDETGGGSLIEGDKMLQVHI